MDSSEHSRLALFRQMEEKPLIHHQGIICCVAFDRSSLRRITYTPQLSLLGALHLIPCW